MQRRRILLIACFVGGAILVILGLWRWPPRFTGEMRVRDRGGIQRIVPRSDFVADREQYDVAWGLADYLSATFLLILGPVVWLRRPRKGEHARSLIDGKLGAWTLVAFVGSLLFAAWAGMVSIGMLVGLARQSWKGDPKRMMVECR